MFKPTEVDLGALQASPGTLSKFHLLARPTPSGWKGTDLASPARWDAASRVGSGGAEKAPGVSGGRAGQRSRR